MIYQKRITQLTVCPDNETIFSEMATRVTIDDDAAGEFVSVHQSASQLKQGEIQINPDEWPRIRAAIDAMIEGCRK